MFSGVFVEGINMHLLSIVFEQASFWHRLCAKHHVEHCLQD